MKSNGWAIGFILITALPWIVFVMLGIVDTYKGINNPEKTCWLWASGIPMSDSPIHMVTLLFVVFYGWLWGVFYLVLSTVLVLLKKVNWKAAVFGLGFGVVVATSPVWAFSWLDDEYEKVAEYAYFNSNPNICGNET